MIRFIYLLGLLATFLISGPGNSPVAITGVTTTLDADFPGGYQVFAADLNNDNRLDVVGLGETVAWLENSTWLKHPITGTQTHNNIDLAPHDIDGDGNSEIVIASEFALNDSTQGGNIHWFRRTSDLNRPWTAHFIDSYPTAHRLRWANADGSGQKVLISAPLLGRGARAPEYDQAAAPLMLYAVPRDPVNDPWPRQIIDATLHMTHGLQIVDFDGDGREEILTASFEGIHLFHSTGNRDKLIWTKTRLCAGEQSTHPSHGSSEVRLGKLKGGQRFIATIEPWHGEQVVVYLEPVAKGKLWQRISIDSSFEEGHALMVLDLDGDSNEEIVAGFRGRKRCVALYRSRDESGRNWERNIVDDGGIACQGLFIADLRGTGAKGLVGIGGTTHNIRLYEFPGR